MRRILILVGIALILTSTVFAANTGRLKGQCLTSDGEALPGVTVQITSEVLIGGPQVAISGADGEFSFNLLAVGDYTVQGSLAGFRSAAGTVRVSADATGSVALYMIPEQFGGEIEVLAEVPVVDTSQVNTRQVWGEDYLKYATVGTANRSYQSVLTQAAGVGGGSNPNVFGSTLGENSYLIDGMNTTDTVVGTFSTNFNMDAVQEINFQTGGFEAEFGQATGGIVNLVTKSGGNQFSGSLDIRYRNQDMAESSSDDNSAQSSNQQISGTLGGPFLRDKLRFFTSLQYVDTSYRGVYDNFDRDYEGYMFLGKATWQVADGHRLIGKFHTDPAEIPGVNRSVFVLESAKAQQDQGGDIWQFELNSVLSASFLLNAQVGTATSYLNRFSSNEPDTISGHQNTVNNLYYNAYSRNNNDERPRDEARVNATWFVDQLAGSHEFKGGIEYTKTGFDQTSYYNGGAFVYDNNGNLSPTYDPIDLNGDGYYNAYINIKEPEDTVKVPTSVSGNIGTIFVQDAWRVHPNLTIKPGIRLDNSILKNHPGDTIADMDTWQPRLGVAWDITGSAKHVIRGSIGRFMDPTTLMIPSFAVGVDETYHEYSTLEYYCNLSRGQWCTPDSLPAAFGDPIFWTNWDGQEYTLYDNRGTTIYEPAQTLDQAGVGTLVAPVVDEIILAYEMQVAPQMSLEFTYVTKEGQDLIEDTCINNTWTYGDGPLPDIDDEGTWTTSAGCTSWLIVNMPMYERTYDAGIVKFEARKGWGNVIASYTYADSQGNNESGPRHYAYGDGDYFPVNFYNHATENIKDPVAKATEIERLKSLKLDVPVVFQKPPGLVVGPRGPVIKVKATDKMDYECELAVVIGKRGKYISQEEAYDHIAGYTILIDVSARDQAFPEDVDFRMFKRDINWTKGKGMENAGPMGPCILTRDEIPDPYDPPTKLITRVNGETRQDGDFTTMIIGIPRLVEYLSNGTTLEPGDVIATGTVAGVARSWPDGFLKVGDVLECEIPPIGSLKYKIVGE